MALAQDITARILQIAAGRPRARLADVRLVAGTEAGAVPVDLYRPALAGGDAPVCINFPDTGFITRTAARDDAACRALADELGCVVLNADLAPAPQVRFPATPAQAQALVWWAMMAGRKHQWNGKRIALRGAGAGANLALGACLDLPARMGAKPLAVAALTPMLDMTEVEGARARVMRSAYLPDRAAWLAPLASPLRAESFEGFPPTLIAACETHPRRGEGAAFAGLLEAAGRDVKLLSVRRAAAARDEVTRFLRRRLADS